MTRIPAISVAFFLPASTAFAHVGHLGELAGHAHWVGAAAVLGAAAIAAALAAKAKKSGEPAAEEEAAESEAEKQSEGASA